MYLIFMSFATQGTSHINLKKLCMYIFPRRNSSLGVVSRYMSRAACGSARYSCLFPSFPPSSSLSSPWHLAHLLGHLACPPGHLVYPPGHLTSGCFASGCLASGCLTSGCLASGCLTSGCLTSGCLTSGCLTSGYLACPPCRLACICAPPPLPTLVITSPVLLTILPFLDLLVVLPFLLLLIVSTHRYCYHHCCRYGHPCHHHR